MANEALKEAADKAYAEYVKGAEALGVKVSEVEPPSLWEFAFLAGVEYVQKKPPDGDVRVALVH